MTRSYLSGCTPVPAGRWWPAALLCGALVGAGWILFWVSRVFVMSGWGDWDDVNVQFGPPPEILEADESESGDESDDISAEEVEEPKQ